MDVTVNNLKEVMDYLKRMPDDMFKNVKEVFKDATLDAANKIKENCASKLTVRSGALRRSINTSLTGSSIQNIHASVYSSQGGEGKEVVYAPVHENGATITAKNAYAKVPGGPYLNIPSNDNKKPSGVMRMTASMVFEHGGYIRGRSVWLGNKMMFGLVKQVTIPARLEMVKTAEDQVPTILSKLAQMIGE